MLGAKVVILNKHYNKHSSLMMVTVYQSRSFISSCTTCSISSMAGIYTCSFYKHDGLNYTMKLKHTAGAHKEINAHMQA